MAEVDPINLMARITEVKMDINRLNDQIIEWPDDARSRVFRDELQIDLETLENEKNEHFKGLSMMHMLIYRNSVQNVRYKREWENEIRARLQAMKNISLLATQNDLRDLDKLQKCAHDIQFYLMMRADPDWDFSFLKDQYGPREMESYRDIILAQVLHIRETRTFHVLLPHARGTHFNSLNDDLRAQIARLSLDQDP